MSTYLRFTINLVCVFYRAFVDQSEALMHIPANIGKK